VNRKGQLTTTEMVWLLTFLKRTIPKGEYETEMAVHLVERIRHILGTDKGKT
jgi:hypothetical protein